MTYAVKEIFYTLQGEGAHAGRPAVFCRFAGCNLWTGRESDRATAVCKFCDTDFVGTDGPGGGKFRHGRRPRGRGRGGLAVGDRRRAGRSSSAPAANRSSSSTSGGRGAPRAGFEVAVETNGTQAAPAGLDWICVSPKAERHSVLTGGDELKLVFPQAGADPERFGHLGLPALLPSADGRPTAGGEHRGSRSRTAWRIRGWRLSLQTHKLIGIP